MKINSRYWHWIAGVALVFVWASYGYAQDARLKKDRFWESVRPDVKVSGTVVVGLTSASLVSGNDLKHIRLRPQADLAGHDVCLTVASRDGIYLSRNTYVLPSHLSEGPVTLPYRRSTKLGLLQRYKERHLGILVRKGDCDSSRGHLLLPQGIDGDAGNVIGVMINGLGATDVYYSLAEPKQSGACDRLRDGRTTVFDFWCRISVPSDWTNRQHTISITRERYGRELPPASLVVAAERPAN